MSHFNRHLVKAGVLTVRDAGTWWLALPSAGVFMKHFSRGRKAVITMIKKSKYKEILLKVCLINVLAHFYFFTYFEIQFYLNCVTHGDIIMNV